MKSNQSKKSDVTFNCGHLIKSEIQVHSTPGAFQARPWSEARSQGSRARRPLWCWQVGRFSAGFAPHKKNRLSQSRQPEPQAPAGHSHWQETSGESTQEPLPQGSRPHLQRALEVQAGSVNGCGCKQGLCSGRKRSSVNPPPAGWPVAFGSPRRAVAPNPGAWGIASRSTAEHGQATCDHIMN